jgi:hypothetical protein
LIRSSPSAFGHGASIVLGKTKTVFGVGAEEHEFICVTFE